MERDRRLLLRSSASCATSFSRREPRRADAWMHQQAFERPALRRAARRFQSARPAVGAWSAGLFLAQFDDLLGETDQINVSGTVETYPNWRRKLSFNLEAPAVANAIALLARAVPGNSGAASYASRRPRLQYPVLARRAGGLPPRLLQRIPAPADQPRKVLSGRR